MVASTAGSGTTGLTSRRGGSKRDTATTTRLAAGRPVTSAGAGDTVAAKATIATLWRVGPDQKLQGTRVTTGISDGQRTVLLDAELPVGTQVVIGATAAGSAGTSATTTTTNPLTPQRTQGGRRPPGAI